MSDKHTLRIFDQDLETLSDELVNLANQVSEELNGALQALILGDHSAADDVIASDLRVDELLDRINAHTMRTLARQQAMASDLRSILAASRIAPHLERVGDYAKNTAKRAKRLNKAVDKELGAQLHWMGERIGSMLQRVTDAYARRDAELANVAWTDDAELDAIYAILFQHLLKLMQEDSGRIADCIQLLLIAKGLERAGDHVTDIAEEVYLMVKGQPLQGLRPKVDETGVANHSSTRSLSENSDRSEGKSD